MNKLIIDVQTGEQQVENLTTEELQQNEVFQRDVLPGLLLEQLRLRRNDLLAETDYLALADSTLSYEMAEYRQQLRDLPANTVDPANPVWPTKPQ